MLSRLRSVALAAVVLVVAALGWSAGLAPHASAQTPPDKSDVVLDLDFSASILNDKANRNRFAAALTRIADRIDAISGDLVKGDTTMSLVQFAATAADYPGCVDIKLKGSPKNVAKLADCLRSVARAYRGGVKPALTSKIGIDTNYVSAMQQASRHLPANAERPAMILFTDGKHDVAGVPVGQVQPTRNRLFGDRSPFALLPVGMGLDAKERKPLQTGLERLRIVAGILPCEPGKKFTWPTVVFKTPAAAGNAVAIALQDATCTFTVAPTPTPPPTPTPTPVPTPAPVRGIGLDAGDGRITVSWVAAPPNKLVPVSGYRVRCRSGEGDWAESEPLAPTALSATFEGLTNGAAYECQVAALSNTTSSAWTAASSTVTPVGRPAPPEKPSVRAGNTAVDIEVPAVDPAAVTGFRYECSADGGSTWPIKLDVLPAKPATQIGNLTNGVDYQCRAVASNASGESEPSAVSDVFRPCGGPLECNPLLLPAVGGLAVVLLLGVLLTLFALTRMRPRAYVVAVVDGVHSANLGQGSSLGISLDRASPAGRVTGIKPDRTKKADIKIRVKRGGKFEVIDSVHRHTASSGTPVITVAGGVHHEVVLWAFGTPTAAAASSRR